VLKIKWEDVALFSRCLQCNEIIVPIEHEMVHGRVPDYVFETHLNFTTCRMCQKIFWPGTHTERSGKYIKELFDTVYAKDKGDSK
jgi:uncharacterized protein with PIN domain